jgi:hypothetical protein
LAAWTIPSQHAGLPETDATHGGENQRPQPVVGPISALREIEVCLRLDDQNEIVAMVILVHKEVHALVKAQSIR